MTKYEILTAIMTCNIDFFSH